MRPEEVIIQAKGGKTGVKDLRDLRRVGLREYRVVSPATPFPCQYHAPA